MEEHPKSGVLFFILAYSYKRRNTSLSLRALRLYIAA